ncbi:MAG TPA: glycerol-3-phosphate acyltransferase, partial [Candidatus Babeliales bacterium]|nr:glycerol-3-phosphate acyltransferase [Candidatus Babeliales bacterium]
IDFNYLCLLASILLFGNGCSLFLRGSGGKGVATVAGLVGALCPMAVTIVFGIWLLIFLLTRTIGIASVGAALCLPIYAYTTHNNAFFLFSLFAALWIVRTHRSNIQLYWTNC